MIQRVSGVRIARNAALMILERLHEHNNSHLRAEPMSPFTRGRITSFRTSTDFASTPPHSSIRPGMIRLERELQRFVQHTHDVEMELRAPTRITNENIEAETRAKDLSKEKAVVNGTADSSASSHASTGDATSKASMPTHPSASSMPSQAQTNEEGACIIS